MTQQLSGRRIFLASPGCLEIERAAIRAAIARFNEENAFDNGVAFITCGWETVAEGADRPQDRINPVLQASDFMVLMLHDRWGSSPGGDAQYESGTEEELAVAQVALGEPDLPLRDILILFKAPPAAQMRDPGPQLTRVLAFRDHLEQRHQVFFGVFDATEEALEKLHRSLRRWSKPLEQKTPRAVSLRPDSSTALQSAITQASDLPIQQLVERAEQLAKDGLITQAEAVFSNATKSDDPDAMMRFARFLRRTGRLRRSYDINEHVVQATATGIRTPDGVRMSDALANMGVIRRKQGRLRESAQQLAEAIRTARRAGTDGQRTLAYALDNLGWTQMRQSELERARSSFEESRAVRVEAGDLRGEAASLVNIGRVAVAMQQPGDAAGALTRAVEIFGDSPDEPALANALVALGEVRLGQRDFTGARRLLEQAMEIDERLGHSDGISVVCNILAQCALESGDVAEAAQQAERCRQESVRSGNHEGLGLALQLFGRIDAREDRPDEAISHFKEAASMFATAGDATREVRVLLELTDALIRFERTAEARDVLERARRRASHAVELAVMQDVKRLDELLC